MGGFLVTIVIVGFLAFILFKSIRIVPQGQEWIVERLGKYQTTLKPGLGLINPIFSTPKALDTRGIVIIGRA